MKHQTNILITLATSASLFLLPQTGLIAQQLVAYYPFNGNALDESGNGNNGTVVGATLTADRFGNENSAYYFSGSQYISTPDSPSLNSTTGLTLAAWVKVSSWSTPPYPRIISKGADGQWDFTAQDGTALHFSTTIGGVSHDLSAPLPSTGVWHHLAATYDGSAIHIYYDGAIQASQAASGNIHLTSSPVYLGVLDPNISSRLPSDSLVGALDDVRVYSRGLSELEIGSLACGGSTPSWVLNPENGHSYALTCVDSSWLAAESEAESYGARLVTMRNANENNWLFQTFGQWSRWIGLYQLANSPEPAGGWVWVNAEPVTYLNWAPGEPNNFLGVNEMFGTIYGSEGAAPGQWNDVGLENAGRLRGIMELVIDSDNDGVPDSLDLCPNTHPGAIVDANGCSIAQLAPCAGPLSGGAWRNHGQYVAAVAMIANEFLAAGLITQVENEVIMAEAARSDCGRHTVTDRQRIGRWVPSFRNVKTP